MNVESEINLINGRLAVIEDIVNKSNFSAGLDATLDNAGDVLKRILNMPHVESELAYLDRGIGIKTENKVWLEAREIVYKMGI